MPVVWDTRIGITRFKKNTLHCDKYARIVDPWQNMEHELKKTNIRSTNETSRYIM
jgi:hypothetical protein